MGRMTCGAAALVLLAASASQASADSILFVGNSFTFGALSPVWKFHAATVTDLNGGGVGGVPALFKTFAAEAGLDYTVSLETVGGKDLQYHLDNKRAVIDQAWDHVVLQSFSTLDAAKPGDSASLITSAAVMAKMFHDKNPRVDVRLTATWSRADLTYLTTGHWYGKPIGAMAKDVEAGYDQAAAGSPLIAGVIPVGLAWNRAFDTGFAGPNPYDGLAPGKVDLWAYDNYHASSFGYYIQALMVFGAVTGKDPLSLGPRETAAMELGISPAQATAMQQIAHDQLATLAKH
ncbi:MAG TPA: DUF4886 domain-containing protein [Caulobacteraceae bacterium]|nr:DUF4886 domain-containing protein [Caulobacteraceae bacterium]